MEAKNFTVSHETAGIINSIQFLQDFKDVYLTALSTIYGEKQGEEFYLEDSAKFDALEESLSRHLMFSVTENMGKLSNDGVI